MIAITVLIVICLSVIGLVAAQLVREQRQVADRARKRAYVQWQQRQAERQIQAITQEAFTAMLDEARQQSPTGGPPADGWLPQ